MVKKIDIHFLEAQKLPNKLDPKRSTPTPIIIKMPAFKDKARISLLRRIPLCKCTIVFLGGRGGAVLRSRERE